MERRTVLRGAAAVAGIGLAGCIAGGTPGNGTDTPTEGPEIQLVDSSFAVENVDNTGEPSADATVHDEDNRVTFTGTIEGSDGCKTAVMDAMEYDREADEIHLQVRTEDREGTEDRACTEALVYVDYEATAEFENGTPRQATVSHNGRAIMSGAHESSRAGDGN
jgi:ABC-type glycerol-3-phosphate transport system substrate-binding protein